MAKKPTIAHRQALVLSSLLFLIICTCKCCLGDQSLFWLNDNSVLEFTDLFEGSPAACILTGDKRFADSKLTTFLTKSDFSPSSISPDGFWLFGTGFGPPTDGHSGSHLLIAVNLRTYEVLTWPRVLDGSLVWANDGKSVYIADPSQKSLAYRTFLGQYIRGVTQDSANVYQLRLDSRVIVPVPSAGEQQWLLGQTFEGSLLGANYDQYATVAVSRLHLRFGGLNGREGFARDVILPRAVKIEDCGYNGPTGCLAILTASAGPNATSAIDCFIFHETYSGSNDFVSDMSTSGNFDQIRISPHGDKILFFSSSSTAYRIANALAITRLRQRKF